jgi:methionine-R-sulfoxide reductase
MQKIILALILITSYSCIYTQNPTDMQSRHTSAQHNDTGEYPIQLDENEWKDRLQPSQYYILRQAGTESPFTGKYYKNKDAGIYYSAATGQPLFVSDAKYDSSCGWPSFFEPITEGVILYRKDTSAGMIRTEIIDSSSGSHLGHVFDDGPPPTGLRYCMNSDAMVFVGIDQEAPALVKEYMEKHASENERKAVDAFIKANL